MTDVEPMIFSQTLEGLFRDLGPLTDAARERFLAIGVDPLSRFEPAYPVEQWLKVIEAAVKVREPDAPFGPALERLGRHFVDGYNETMIGKAMLAMLRVMGPRWALTRLRRNFSTGSNFFETSAIERAPGEMELWLNRVTWPEWYFGVIGRGLEYAGAREVRVSLLSHEGPSKGATVLVTWSVAPFYSVKG